MSDINRTELRRLESLYQEGYGDISKLVVGLRAQVDAAKLKAKKDRATLERVQEILSDEWLNGRVLPAALYADTSARVHAIRAALAPVEEDDIELSKTKSAQNFVLDTPEDLIKMILHEVQRIGDAGQAGPYVHRLPKELKNWGYEQTLWPVVVAVDAVFESISPEKWLPKAQESGGVVPSASQDDVQEAEENWLRITRPRLSYRPSDMSEYEAMVNYLTDAVRKIRYGSVRLGNTNVTEMMLDLLENTAHALQAQEAMIHGNS